MEKWKGNKLNTIIYIFVILISFWMGYIIVYGRGGIIQRKDVEKKLMLLDTDILNLERKRDMIDLQIKNLKNNEKYIEGYAREQGYKKEGEIIFKFIKKKEETIDGG